jgi:serine/threonine protein kinase
MVAEVDDAGVTYMVEEDIAHGKRFTKPFLVTYYDSFRFIIIIILLFEILYRHNGYVCIVMEVCNGGDLSKLLRNLNKSKGIVLDSDVFFFFNYILFIFFFSLKRIMKIFVQMVLGLNELHTEHLIHRDIKAENTFINDRDDIKIGVLLR